MDKETIIVDGQPIEVELKPLSILCHPGTTRIDVPNRIEIGSPNTVIRARQLTDFDLEVLCPLTSKFFDMVFGKSGTKMPRTVEELRNSVVGVQHIVGLLSMFVNAILEGKQVFFRLPETHLHPSECTGLADMFNYMTKAPKKARRITVTRR